MAEEKTRFLLLTQNPALTAQVKNALSGAVEVRDPNLLAPLLERGTDLLVLDLSLPQRTLRAVVSLLDGHRQVPVLVLAPSGAEEWYGLSHGNPLEAVLEASLPPRELRRRAEDGQPLDPARRGAARDDAGVHRRLAQMGQILPPATL